MLCMGALGATKLGMESLVEIVLGVAGELETAGLGFGSVASKVLGM